MKKFTFKKTIHEGRYQSFQKDHTIIKLNKKEVGYISEIEYNKYKVYFALKKERTEIDPAPFRWVSIKKHFNSENEARKHIKENNDAIQSKLNLHYFDD